jgi:hypothetical protein
MTEATQEEIDAMTQRIYEMAMAVWVGRRGNALDAYDEATHYATAFYRMKEKDKRDAIL